METNPMNTDVAESRASDGVVEKVDAAAPQSAAVNMIMNMKKNIIIWDSCGLIYDAADLVKGKSKADEVAVYGIQGSLRTPEQQEKPFSARHYFEFHGSKRYSMDLYLSDTRKPISIQHSEQGPDGGLSYFEAAVLGLTACLEENGLEETMKLFFEQ